MQNRKTEEMKAHAVSLARALEDGVANKPAGALPGAAAVDNKPVGAIEWRSAGMHVMGRSWKREVQGTGVGIHVHLQGALSACLGPIWLRILCMLVL